MLKYLTAGACLFFLAYVISRAIHVALTYDEAAAYIKFISAGVLAAFSFAYSTNHILYTLLAQLFYTAGGNRDMVLRLPSVLGYSMYLGFSILSLGLLGNRLVAFAGFLLLNLNAYLLDYFALSRGYGLALGFLMGALFFLFRFLTRLDATSPPGGDLSRALAMALGAVLANFAMLNLYLGILTVALIAIVVSNRAVAPLPSSPSVDRPPPSSKRKAIPWLLPVVAAGFTFLVFSQDAGLSSQLYEPLAVKLVGLNRAQLDRTKVMTFGIRGGKTDLVRQGDAWRSDGSPDVTLLRVESPASAPLAAIHVEIGKYAFWHTFNDGTWKWRQAGETLVLEANPSLSLPKSWVPAFSPIINWRGDGPHVLYLLARTGLVLLMLGLVGALLRVLGWLAVRARVLRWDQWGPLSSSALWAATLVGSPLYLLVRNSELYFGGSRGLVQDAFESLVQGSFYGRRYFDHQTATVTNIAVAAIVVFAIVLYGSYRSRGARPVLPGVSLLALLGLVSLAVVIERLVLRTPYPLGRTALFYIPLYVLLATFCCDALAKSGPVGRIATTALVVPVLAAATYHFATTANVTSMRDWPGDADTKTMIGDLDQLLAARPHEPTVLEVRWDYWPVASIYASRASSAGITVVRQPSPTPSDFVYTREQEQVDPLKVIKRYPRSGNALARTH